MSNDRRLMRLHVEALFTHDDLGRLVRVNVDGGARAPRFFIGVTADGVVRRFRHDVDDEMKRALEDVSLGSNAHDDERVPNVEQYRTILERQAAVERVWAGPVFSFPPGLPRVTEAILVTDDNTDILRALLPDWMPDVRLNPPLFAIVADGQAVSVCCSVRRTSDAHEAGVETVPAYRGRGYAATVVSAWAHAVRATGVIPLYSTSWENDASRGVARKLGLTRFGSDMHIT